MKASKTPQPTRDPNPTARAYGVATMRDVEAIEAAAGADQVASTYEVIRRTAGRTPDAPALSFFLTVDQHARPETWTYRDLFARITQTANFFHRLGATKNSVIAFVLPNLPETHAVIWGGQATGIVLALNPLLEGCKCLWGRTTSRAYSSRSAGPRRCRRRCSERSRHARRSRSSKATVSRRQRA